MRILKQSTQIIVPVGAFVDATDGFTLETSISFATTEANIIKSGAAAVTDIGTNTWSAHLGGGYYNVTLTASNTDTLGLLLLEAHDTAARPVRHEFMVVPANVYDSFIAGSDNLLVDVTLFNGNAASGILSGTTAFNADAVKINGNASSGYINGTGYLKADVRKINDSETAATSLSASTLGLVVSSVNDTSATTTSMVTSLTESTNDHYNGRTVIFTSGALSGQAGTILDYNGSTKAITFTNALTEAPSNGISFVIA